MNKETFVTIFKELQAFYNQSQKLGTVLLGVPMATFGRQLTTSCIDALAEASGINADLIEKLLYEGSFFMHIGFEGFQKEYRIVTAEGLWEANEAYCALFISSGNIGKES